MNGADFKGAKLHQVLLQGAKLDKADFKQANLSETTFQGAVLRETDFSFATLDGVNFRGVSLSGAILKGTKMRNIQGLSDEQLQECATRGALIESPLASEVSKQ